MCEGLFSSLLPDILKLLIEKNKQILNFLPDMRTKAYFKRLSSPDYIAWQNEVLMNYYGARYFTYEFGSYHPVYTFTGSPEVQYPFKGLCSKLTPGRKVYNYTTSSIYRRYRTLLKRKIRRPQLEGFVLDKFSFDSNMRIKELSASVSTYADNIYTSHILEYELFLCYKKFADRPIDRQTFSQIKEHLPLRNKIHKGKKHNEVLTTGYDRASLLGVQLLIIFLDSYDNEYKAVYVKRSQDVASKPGYYQFVPSGGFEIFSDAGPEIHTNAEIESNFSALDAVFREYLEELFNKKEFESGVGGDYLAQIRNHKEVNAIMRLVDEDKASFLFLGTVVELISLRNELSFLLVIKDNEYSKRLFKPNHESKQIDRASLKMIEKLFSEDGKINPSSAALWHLFKKHDIYKEISEN